MSVISKCTSPTTDQCECEQGFMSVGKKMKFCVDIDECGSCDKNADCENTVGSFICSCKSGYLGNGFLCIDLNECHTGAHMCDKETICTNTDGSYSCCYTNGQGILAQLQKRQITWSESCLEVLLILNDFLPLVFILPQIQQQTLGLSGPSITMKI